MAVRGGVVDLTRLYLDDIGRRALLSADEERRLSELVQQGLGAAREPNDPHVTPARRRKLRRAVDYGEEARRVFVEANLRLVVWIARQYPRRGLDLLDLVQEGNIGLVKAVDRFDGRQGHRFSTYATWWIRQSITRALDTSSRSIRVPAHRYAEYRVLVRLKEEVEAELHRPATVQELADASGIDIDRVRADLELPAACISLSAPGADDRRPLQDALADPSAASPVVRTNQRTRCDDVDRLVATLPPRLASVVRLRYGLVDGEPLTRDQVAQRIGISRERVRQLEQRALARLRRTTPAELLDQLLAA